MWKDIWLHITFRILRCHSQTRWSMAFIIYNSLPYRLGTVPQKRSHHLVKTQTERPEESGFDLGTGRDHRKLPRHPEDLWVLTVSWWRQAWRVRGEPAQVRLESSMVRLHRPFLSFITFMIWTLLCCCSHSNNEGKESRNAGTRNQLALAKQSLCFPYFSLLKEVTSTSLLHHLSTPLPLSNQVLRGSLGQHFPNVGQYLLRACAGCL